MKKYNLDKENIKRLGMAVWKWLNDNKMDRDASVYFNHKRIRKVWDELVVDKDIHPIDYCEYTNPNNIVTIISEGPLYDWADMFSALPNGLIKLAERYGCYWEHCTGWCWTLCLSYDENKYESYEPDTHEVPAKPVTIYMNMLDEINTKWPKLCEVMEYWWHLSEKTGDIGSCVIGAYMEFNYKDVIFHLLPCSPYQGECSWTPHIGVIKQKLRDIGASDISYHCGIMD